MTQQIAIGVITSLTTALIGFLVGKLVKNDKTFKALRLGLQAVLRDRLLQSYRHYADKGYCEIDDRSNWENMFLQYENLEGNGVMTDIRTKLLALPTEKA